MLILKEDWRDNIAEEGTSKREQTSQEKAKEDGNKSIKEGGSPSKVAIRSHQLERILWV